MRNIHRPKRLKHITKSKWKSEEFDDYTFKFMHTLTSKKISNRYHERDKNIICRYNLWRVVKNSNIDSWYTYEGNWENSRSKAENKKLWDMHI